MIKSHSKILTATLLVSFSGLTNAASIYLNVDNISVSIGTGTSEGSFNNTFNNGNTINKVIDAPTADAEEFHNQTTHIWFTADTIGGGLELDFDFGSAFDITTLHFWNYTGEGFDVDNIDFTFFNSANQEVGALSIEPNLGTSPGIRAQNIALDAPLNVEFVTAFLSGDNRQVDFQNIGFTAAPSAIPIPAAAWLFLSGIISLATFARRQC